VQKEQIDILKEVFEEWLQIHDLDYEFWIYTGDEWRERGETILEGARAVIAFENQLVNLLNFSIAPWYVEDELQDLAGGFGYGPSKARPSSLLHIFQTLLAKNRPVGRVN
jgi:hypothetical protein